MVSIRVKCGLVGLLVALVCTGMVLAVDAPADPGKGKGNEQLEQAKARVRAKFQERLNAAMKAMEQGHKRGAPIEAAEVMANAGLQQGLDAKDFEPLGRFVAEQHAKGLKGQGLGKAIHAEVRRRQMVREQARQAKRKGQGEAKGKNQGAQKGKAAAGKQQGQGKGKGKGEGKDKGRDRDKGREGRGRN